MPLTLTVAPEPPSQAVWALSWRAWTAVQPARNCHRPRGGSDWPSWRALSAVTGIGALALALTLADTPADLPPIVVVLSDASRRRPRPAAKVRAPFFVASISADGPCDGDQAVDST